MASMEVAGEVVSPGIQMAREAEENLDPPLGTIPGVELDSAKVFFDLDSAIAAGHISMEEVTGGVRVDAETGEVSDAVAEQPFVDSKSQFGREISAYGIRLKETADWKDERGPRVARALGRIRSATRREEPYSKKSEDKAIARLQKRQAKLEKREARRRSKSENPLRQYRRGSAPISEERAKRGHTLRRHRQAKKKALIPELAEALPV